MGIHRINAVIHGLAGKDVIQRIGSTGTGKTGHKFGAADMAMLLVLAHRQPDPGEIQNDPDPIAFINAANLGDICHITDVFRVKNFLMEKNLITYTESEEHGQKKDRRNYVYRVRLDTIRNLSAGDDEDRWIDEILHLNRKVLSSMSAEVRKAYALGVREHESEGVALVRHDTPPVQHDTPPVQHDTPLVQHDRGLVQHDTNNRENKKTYNQQQQHQQHGSVVVGGDASDSPITYDMWKGVVAQIAARLDIQQTALSVDYLRNEIDRAHYDAVLFTIATFRAGNRMEPSKAIGALVNAIRRVLRRDPADLAVEMNDKVDTILANLKVVKPSAEDKRRQAEERIRQDWLVCKGLCRNFSGESCRGPIKKPLPEFKPPIEPKDCWFYAPLDYADKKPEWQKRFEGITYYNENWPSVNIKAYKDYH